MIDITQYSPDKTGQTDCSNAITQACTAAASNGEWVYFPPGRYLITERISVPTGVKIFGAFIGQNRTLWAEYPNGKHFPYPSTNWGTTIITRVPLGNAAGAIILNDFSAIEGFTIYDDRNLPENVPTPQMPALFINAGHVKIRDIEFVNVWQGVKVVGGAYNADGLYGQPIAIGWETEISGDFSIISNVYWGRPLYKQGPQSDYTHRNGKAFLIRYQDGLSMYNVGIFRYGTAFYFDKNGANGNGANGVLFNCGADSCVTAYDFRYVQWHLRINNANCPTDGNPLGSAMGLVNMEDAGNGTVFFSNSSFSWFESDPAKNGYYIKLKKGKLHLNHCFASGSSPKNFVENTGGQLWVDGVSKGSGSLPKNG